MVRKDVSFRTVIILVTCVFLVSCMRTEDYREIIEKKGVPFTQESFLREVKEGNRENTGLFIKAGIDINSKDKDGSTALMVASENGDLQMAQLLIQNGADVNANNIDGYTALMYAAYKGNVQIAELLIKNKAHVNARDKDGWTALRYASIQRRDDIIKMLTKARDQK